MLKKIKNRYIKILSLTLLSLAFIACGGSSSSSSGGDSSSFSVTLVDGYIIDANVSDAYGTEANQSKTDLGKYTFPTTPVGELSAIGGVFEANTSVSNQIVLKAPAQSAVISPITTLLVDYPSLNSTLQNALNVTEKQLRGNFLSSNNLKIAKLAQVVYIIYKTDIVDEVNTSLTTTPPSNLDELIENIALVADEHITDNNIRANTLLFLDKVKTYNASTDRLEVFTSPYKGALQGEGPSLVNYWAKTYGGSGSDYAYSITQASDEGYVVAGYTYSFGVRISDFWVLKLDNSGDITWQRAYGGSGDDYANSIITTSDGGYIVAGNTSSFGQGSYDAWVLKLDSSGDITWQRAYGGSGYDRAYSIIQTSDGGYVVAGNTSSFGQGSGDFWVLKLDASGDIVWQKTYGGSGTDVTYSTTTTSDGGYVVAGYTGSFGQGNHDFWVLKLSSDGNITWQKAYGGSGSDYAQSITTTSDGGYVVAGYTGSFGQGDSDFWVLKLSSDGNITWQKAYGGNSDDQANSITTTSDGGYIVAGYTTSFGQGGSSGAWVLKLDSSGDIEWQRAYGGSGDDYANSIIQTSDGRYVVAGYTTSFGQGGNFWVLKLDSSGYIVFRPTSGATLANTTASTTNSTAIASSSTATVSSTTATPIDTTAIETNTTADITSQAP